MFMRKFTLSLIVAGFCFLSCAVKRGCPSDGRNIGAERLVSGDPKVMKDLKKAKKFRGGKF